MEYKTVSEKSKSGPHKPLSRRVVRRNSNADETSLPGRRRSHYLAEALCRERWDPVKVRRLSLALQAAVQVHSLAIQIYRNQRLLARFGRLPGRVDTDLGLDLWK